MSDNDSLFVRALANPRRVLACPALHDSQMASVDRVTCVSVSATKDSRDNGVDVGLGVKTAPLPAHSIVCCFDRLEKVARHRI